MGTPTLTALFYYVLGGVTFVPLCLLAGLCYFVVFAPRVAPSASHASLSAQLSEAEGDISPEVKAAALDLASRNGKAIEQVEAAQRSGLSEVGASVKGVPGAAKRVGSAQLPKAYRSGWLVVRRQFDPTAVAVAQTTASADAASVGANSSSASSNAALGQNQAKPSGYMSAMYRGIMDYRTTRKQSLAPPASSDGPGAGSTSSDSGRGASSDGTQSQRSRDSSPSRRSASSAPSPAAAALKDSYFCILKEPILYLYSSEDTGNPSTECLAAIDLRDKRVSIYVSGMGDVEGEPSPAGDDGAAESGDTSTDSDSPAARIAANWSRAKRLAIKDGELFQKRNAIRILASTQTAASWHGRRPEWFVFLRSSTTMEDWYHALVHASLLPKDPSHAAKDPIGPVFDPDDMQSLLTSLDSLPDPIPLRWLNAMVGRIFYSVYRTAWLEEYVTRKLTKKISRVRTPSFLSDIRVKEVDLGSTPPAFSRPMLKSLTGAGEASMEVGVHYSGALRLTISTVLTISLGSRFKPYNVPLVLAVVLTSLEGNLLLHVKPPPSNRLWFAFTQLPKMEIDIEPVVSERKVQWSMVKRLIEGRIKELLIESVVVPNMDDVPFYDTRPNVKRGGIWAEAAVSAKADEDTSASAPASMPAGEVEDHGITTATAAAGDEGAGASLRNRRPDGYAKSTQSTQSEPDDVVQTSSSTSPAVAGLSALLARNAQVSGGAPNAGQDGGAGRAANPAQPPAKRKSWFATSGRAGNPGQAAAAAAAGSNGANRHKGPQSSLAWGSASVIQGPKPATRASEGDDGGETESLARHHERNKQSISSMLSNVTETSTATADTDAVNAALEHSLDLDRHGALEVTDLSTPTAERPAERPRSVTLPPTESLTPEEDAGQGHTPDSGPALTSLTLPDVVVPRTSSPEATSDAVSAPTLPSSTTGFAPPPRRQPSGAGASGLVARPAHLARTSSRDSRLTMGSSRSFADDSASTHSTGSGSGATSVGSTQAALIAGWSRAKATMADKDSRQAAARDAKDALKKGWASWNARRADSRSQTPSARESPIPHEGSRAARQTGGGDGEDPAWSLGSTATDPVSLGAGFGFEMSPAGSPEWQRRGRVPLPPESAQHAPPGHPPSSPSRVRDYRSHRSEVSSRASSPALSVGNRRTAPQGRPSREDTATRETVEVGELQSTPTDIPRDADARDKDGHAFLPLAARPASAVVTAQDSEGSPARASQKGSGDVSTPTPTPRAHSDVRASSASASASVSATSSPSPSRPPQDTRTASSESTRIRSQPGQMTMMAIPGIPSHRRSIGSSSASGPGAPGAPGSASSLPLGSKDEPGVEGPASAPTDSGSLDNAQPL
ncbi:unnamed protein product [Parajaminaea phylloscopi]